MKGQREKQRRSITHCAHVLTAYISQANGSEMWKRGENKAVRECIHEIASDPRKFPLMMGDRLPDGSSFSGESSDDAMSTAPSLTPNYVSAIASGEDVSSIDLPILQLTEPPKMAFEGNSNGEKTNRSHFTRFWLCDGSGNQMLGRAAMHLAHDGNRLREGDIIRLELFTPCTCLLRAERSPVVLVHRYTVVGAASLPRDLHDPIVCADADVDAGNNLPEGRPFAASGGGDHKIRW